MDNGPAPDEGVQGAGHLPVLAAADLQDDHTRGRLRSCADRLARDVFAGDEDGEAAVEDAPLRPHPVTRCEMDTGFIELF